VSNLEQNEARVLKVLLLPGMSPAKFHIAWMWNLPNSGKASNNASSRWDLTFHHSVSKRKQLSPWGHFLLPWGINVEGWQSSAMTV